MKAPIRSGYILKAKSERDFDRSYLLIPIRQEGDGWHCLQFSFYGRKLEGHHVTFVENSELADLQFANSLQSML